jgi:hypothetical protein
VLLFMVVVRCIRLQRLRGDMILIRSGNRFVRTRDLRIDSVPTIVGGTQESSKRQAALKRAEERIRKESK